MITKAKFKRANDLVHKLATDVIESLDLEKEDFDCDHPITGVTRAANVCRALVSSFEFDLFMLRMRKEEKKRRRWKKS